MVLVRVLAASSTLWGPMRKPLLDDLPLPLTLVVMAAYKGQTTFPVPDLGDAGAGRSGSAGVSGSTGTSGGAGGSLPKDGGGLNAPGLPN
jgi:hypothetical protein